MSLSLWEWGQVVVITVKEVSLKECRPPHSHLYYLSTCQSICLVATQCWEDWQTPFTSKTCICARRKRCTLNAALRSATLPLFNVFQHFLIITPVDIKNSEYFMKAVLQTVIRLTAQSRSHYICLSLWLEIHFKCQVSFYFFWTKHRMNKKRDRGQTQLKEEVQEITCQTVSLQSFDIIQSSIPQETTTDRVTMFVYINIWLDNPCIMHHLTYYFILICPANWDISSSQQPKDSNTVLWLKL